MQVLFVVQSFEMSGVSQVASGGELAGQCCHGESHRFRQYDLWVYFIIALLATLHGYLYPYWVEGHLLELEQASFYLAMVACSVSIARECIAKVLRGALDIHVLMLLVAYGAASIGAHGEGAVLLLLFSLSEALEDYASQRTNKEIQALYKHYPESASLVMPDGEVRVVPVEKLKVGDCVRVLPGDHMPVDGEVLRGATEVDEGMISGESLPVEKGVGKSLYSGTLNLSGSIDLKVLRLPEESRLSQIIQLVESARSSKISAKKFADIFGERYAWGVLGVGAGMFCIWYYLFDLPAFSEINGEESAFYRAMTLMVVASPCALVLSIPSAMFSCISRGASRGILFKSGEVIERLSMIDAVAFDKTGTLTQGQLKVVDVRVHTDVSKDALICLAYGLALHSKHPISRAIVEYARSMGSKAEKLDHFESMGGNGLKGAMGKRICLLGKREWLMEEGINITLNAERADASIEAWVACGGSLMGVVLLSDTARPAVGAFLQELRSKGLSLQMLTGDNRVSAVKIAKQIGLLDEEVLSELSPEGKLDALKQKSRKGSKIAMVGDGINDAPSLAGAFVSVGMGGKGSDAALEVCDIVLMDDRIERFGEAFGLSCATQRVIRQNLGLAVLISAVMIVLTIAMPVPLSIGVVAHEGSTVLVCLNSLRLLFYRN